MSEIQNPRPTGRQFEIEAASLAGSVAAWDGDQPVLLALPGSDALYLPVFKSEAMLRDLFDMLKLRFTSIKRVDDGNEFLSSFAGSNVVVISDLRMVEGGRFRFLQLVPKAEGTT
jgi:hypothetical protein